VNDAVFTEMTCTPSPVKVSMWLGMVVTYVGAAGWEMSTTSMPPVEQVGS
jgi:hypothetical protein